MYSLESRGMDPQLIGKGSSTYQGFTIIEMMIALGVLAIIFSLALPSYRTLLEKRLVTSAAEQAMAFLSTAQLESVKRNQTVAINYQSNSGNWCFGMIAGDDDTVDCDCAAGTCLLDGQEKTLWRTTIGSDISDPDVLEAVVWGGESGTIRFDPVRGVTRGAGSERSGTIQFISPDQSTYALNVNLNPTGRISICSDTDRSDKAVPGYEECQ